MCPPADQLQLLPLQTLTVAHAGGRAIISIYDLRSRSTYIDLGVQYLLGCVVAQEAYMRPRALGLFGVCFTDLHL